jgi:hypothetical protein
MYPPERVINMSKVKAGMTVVKVQLPDNVFQAIKAKCIPPTEGAAREYVQLIVLQSVRVEKAAPQATKK